MFPPGNLVQGLNLNVQNNPRVGRVPNAPRNQNNERNMVNDRVRNNVRNMLERRNIQNVNLDVMSAEEVRQFYVS